MAAPLIDPRAIVASDAVLAPDVVVGPYAIVEGGVRLGRGCRIEGHAVVRRATLGENCIVHPFAVVGGRAQTRQLVEHQTAEGGLTVGNRVEIREHVTIHAGTDGRHTRIGDDALLMAGCHVAHDCVLGCGVTVANAVQLAGHVTVGNYVTFGGLAAVGQWLSIGDYAFVAGGALCEQDVPPYVIVQGDRARVRGINRVGLQRNGFPQEIIARLEAVLRATHRRGTPRAVAVRPYADDPLPEVRRLVAALLVDRPSLRASSATAK